MPFVTVNTLEYVTSAYDGSSIGCGEIMKPQIINTDHVSRAYSTNDRSTLIMPMGTKVVIKANATELAAILGAIPLGV